MALGRRTPATFFLLIAIAAGFGLQLATGGSQAGALTKIGANYGPVVWQGQYWRLVTSMFLHADFLHIVLNGWALFQLGALFESWMGSSRTLLVFFVTGIAGSLASAVISKVPSVGASGAIFGLLGALIAILLRRRSALTPQGKSILMQLVFWAAINVIIGFSNPVIDNAAHLGGCAAGLLLGFLLPPPRPLFEPVSPPVPQPAGSVDYGDRV